LHLCFFYDLVQFYLSHSIFLFLCLDLLIFNSLVPELIINFNESFPEHKANVAEDHAAH
jgi:hypothetical protein